MKMDSDSAGMNGGVQQGQAVAASKEAEIASNLQKALAEERGKRKDLEDRLAKIEADRVAAEKAATEQKAKEKGQYEPLYAKAQEELTAAQKRLADYEAREATRKAEAKAEAEKIVASWNDSDRALMPSGLDEEAQLAFARRLDARLKTVAPSRPSGTVASGGTQSGYIPPECVAQAKRIGKTSDEEIKAFLPIWLNTTAGKAWQAKQAQPK